MTLYSTSKSAPAEGRSLRKIQFNTNRSAATASQFPSSPSSAITNFSPSPSQLPSSPYSPRHTIINLDKPRIERVWSHQSKRIFTQMMSRIDVLEHEKIEARNKALNDRKKVYENTRKKLWSSSAASSTSSTTMGKKSGYSSNLGSSFILESVRRAEALKSATAVNQQALQWYQDTFHHQQDDNTDDKPQDDSSSSSSSLPRPGKSQIPVRSGNNVKILHEFKDPQCTKRWKVAKGSNVAIESQPKGGANETLPVAAPTFDKAFQEPSSIIAPSFNVSIVADDNFNVEVDGGDITLGPSNDTNHNDGDDAIVFQVPTVDGGLESYSNDDVDNEKEQQATQTTTLEMTQSMRDARNSWMIEKPDSFLVAGSSSKNGSSSFSTSRRPSSSKNLEGFAGQQASIHVHYKPMNRNSSWSSPTFQQPYPSDIDFEKDTGGESGEGFKNAFASDRSLLRLNTIGGGAGYNNAFNSIANGLNMIPVIPTASRSTSSGHHYHNTFNGYANHVNAVRMDGGNVEKSPPTMPPLLQGSIVVNGSSSNNETTAYNAAKEAERFKDELELFIFTEGLCSSTANLSIPEIQATIDRYTYQKSLDPSVLHQITTTAKTSTVTSGYGYTFNRPDSAAEWIHESLDKLTVAAAPSKTSGSSDGAAPNYSRKKKWNNIYAKQEQDLILSIKSLDAGLTLKKEFSKRFEAESNEDLDDF